MTDATLPAGMTGHWFYADLAARGGVDFLVVATDPDGDEIAYTWNVYDEDGSLLTTTTGSEGSFRFEPEAGATGLFYVQGWVEDGEWSLDNVWPVYIGEPDPFSITTDAALPGGTESTETEDLQLEEEGGVGSVVWRVVGDALPGSFRLWSDGYLRYARPFPGDWTLDVEAEDGLGRIASKTFTLHVDERERTARSPAPVPHGWIDEYAPEALEAAGGDYESAAVSDAQNGNGAVWECFVAGLAPEDNWDEPWDGWRFRAKIEMKDGAAVVTPDPDLGAARVYTVVGAETISDTFGPTNATSRFFRVKVELP